LCPSLHGEAARGLTASYPSVAAAWVLFGGKRGLNAGLDEC